MTLHGRKVYVYAASGGLAGVSADGGDRGSVLFETADFNQSVVAPSPVQVGDNRIFMTAGYGAGSALFQVNKTGTAPDGRAALSITLVSRHGVKEALASEQQTPIYRGGHLYAILPKDAGTNRDQFVCVDERDPGAVKWASGQDNLFGLGPFIIADNKFYILSDYGVLTVAAVSANRFEKKGTVKIMDGIDAWGPMALADGRLLVRDSKRMFCADIRLGR
jgi:outer membrane protein assembly factor BamB